MRLIPAPRTAPLCSAVLTVRAELSVRAEAHPLLMLRSELIFHPPLQLLLLPLSAPIRHSRSHHVRPYSPCRAARSAHFCEQPACGFSFVLASCLAFVVIVFVAARVRRGPQEALLPALMEGVLEGKKRIECSFCGCAFFDATKLQKHALTCEGAADPAEPEVAGPAFAGPAPVSASIPALPPVSISAPSSAPTARSSLRPANIDAAASDFYAWLREPPMPTEGMLRKVASEKALMQLREGLRQVVREADREVPTLFAAGVQLRLLVLPNVVSAVLASVQRRGRRAATLYPVALC